jgi:hypothetical protein
LTGAAYYHAMNHNDEKLRAVLKQWCDVEPPASFEANVWRQIRTSRVEQTGRVSLIDLIGRLLWQPAWSMAAALVMAVIVGIWGGVASVPRQADRSKAELEFLSPGTLAGSYLQMAGKETR